MNTKQGFTLIEVLIGLFIAIIAATYAAKTITSTNKVVAAGRETFVATNLAHEGLDLTRAMRDNAWFTDLPPVDRSEWLSKSGICPTAANNTYTIDPDVVRDFANDQNTTVLSADEPELYMQTNKLWTHAASPVKTKYKRVIEASCGESIPGKDPAYATITSTVTWEGQGGIAKTVQLKELLYNWLP